MSPYIQPMGSRPSAASRTAWAPGPEQPRLAAGVVDVWRVDLGAVSTELDALLSSDERDRAARIVRARERERWRRSRGALRALLARYTGEDASALRFETGPQGKPALESTGQRSAAQLHFNVSHSRELALFAITTSGAVGIDVETAGARTNEVAIAARLLRADAARRLERLTGPEREREFLRLWTRHEAEIKLRGTTIAAGERPPPVGGPLAAEPRDAEDEDYSSDPCVVELDVGPQAAAALALERAPGELRLWLWS